MTQSLEQLRVRFESLWRQLGAQSSPGIDLLSNYSEPIRSYHGVSHLVSCLQTFDEVREYAEQPDQVELAIWFHDAVYDSRRDDNELQSADLLVAHAKACGIPRSTRESVYRLVLATDHKTPPSTPDEYLLVDIDLEILAADEVEFDRYEGAVRQEYSWVPEELFRQGRRQVLESFSSRDQIYRTKPFRQLEEQARRNLDRALRSLE